MDCRNAAECSYEERALCTLASRFTKKNVDYAT